jgi:hypothetical protein
VNDEAVMFVYSAVNTSVSHVEYDAAIVGIFHTRALSGNRSFPARSRARVC